MQAVYIRRTSYDDQVLQVMRALALAAVLLEKEHTLLLAVSASRRLVGMAASRSDGRSGR